MPYNRPGPGVYVTNSSGGTIQHGAPCLIDNFAGVAVKQQTPPWTQGYQVPALIEDGEPFFIITKGVVQVPNADISSAAKGDDVFVSADGTLGTSGDAPFGRVVEVAGERGTPQDQVRIDLDIKAAAAAAAAPGGTA